MLWTNLALALEESTLSQWKKYINIAKCFFYIDFWDNTLSLTIRSTTTDAFYTRCALNKSFSNGNEMYLSAIYVTSNPSGNWSIEYKTCWSGNIGNNEDMMQK